MTGSPARAPAPDPSAGLPRIDLGLTPARLPRGPRRGDRIRRFLLSALSGWVLPALFFSATTLSTLVVGGLHGIEFWSPELVGPGAPSADALEWARRLVVHGAPFSFTLLLILFAHEMGHYLTARHYRVRTTLPFFLPFPSIIGTIGAFIVIKSPFPHRKALIDVGLAGPFAGFAVVIPAVIVGVATSRLQPAVEAANVYQFGEPLLLQWLSSLYWSDIPEGQALFMSPITLAAWFGLLLTAINLMPMGQLDGGHAAYALFGRGAHRLSRAVFLLLFPMAYFGPSWLVWAFLAFLLGFRRPHPPTLYDGLPLPTSRKVMGALALVVFILCVTPEPIAFDWSDLS